MTATIKIQQCILKSLKLEQVLEACLVASVAPLITKKAKQ